MSANIVVVTRGDSYTFNLAIKDPNNRSQLYTLSEDDAVYLGIMAPHQPFEEAIIKKKFTKEDQDEDLIIHANIQCEYLEQMIPGIYYYSVKLRQNIGSSYEQVITVINKTKFVIND